MIALFATVVWVTVVLYGAGRWLGGLMAGYYATLQESYRRGYQDGATFGPAAEDPAFESSWDAAHLRRQEDFWDLTGERS